MAETVLGLDVGGANLKAALSDRTARSRPFALWKAPGRLADELAALVSGWRWNRVAVTMTAEMCDCFENRAEGVRAVLAAVRNVYGDQRLAVWTVDGRFVTAADATADPMPAASANWLATAVLSGRRAADGFAILLDIGSTTTDVVPISDGVPVPHGRTDADRSRCSELVYTGVRRTPVCAVLDHSQVAAEFFATTLDVGLLLGTIPEESENRDTADGRPATAVCAHARLARMVYRDGDSTPRDETFGLARTVRTRQRESIAGSVERIRVSRRERTVTLILTGVGEDLGQEVAESVRAGGVAVKVCSLSEALGPTVSTAACAYAVAILAAEGGFGP